MIKVTVTLEASSKEEACALLMRIGNQVTRGSVAGFKMGFDTGNYDFKVERDIDAANNGASGKNKTS